MNFDRESFWKNFELGTELHIAGNFIYDGLLAFDKLEIFEYTHEIFTSLYNLSVGIERLAKVAVILLEHSSRIDQDTFEKSLITHTHEELVRRIKAKTTLALDTKANKFLALLGNFYNSMRYGRFGIDSINNYKPERNLVVNFLSGLTKTEIADHQWNVTPNDDKFRIALGKVVKRITIPIYHIINQRAGELNIFTTEIISYSKAYKIFLGENFTFINERIMQKELLIYFLNKRPDDGFFRFLYNMEPINFDQSASYDYVRAMLDFTKGADILDELESICEDYPITKDRHMALKAFDNASCIDFENDDEDN